MFHRAARRVNARDRVLSHTRTLGVLVVGLALGLFGSVGSAAADDASSPVTWSVQPADASAPDGRSWIEQTLDPGESVVEHLAVHNFSDREVTFRLVAADGVFNQNGRFNILPSDQKSTGAGTWIDIPDAVKVPAGETIVVAFSTTVPSDAEPGDHAAGVAASVLTTNADSDGATVGVESRVGFRVMTRVTGELSPGLEVGSLAANYRTSWNPFSPGAVSVDFDVKNTGNTRLRVSGTVEVSGKTLAFPVEGEPQELLSGDTRHFTVAIADAWPFFALPVTVTVDPTVVVVSGDAPEMASTQASAVAWAIPWPQLLVLLGLGLIIFALLWGRVRSRRRIKSLLADAREEGRREAAVEGTK